MFERFTEKARRVIFFAHYECSSLGSSQIGTEHLLFGLLRETPGIAQLYLKLDATDITRTILLNRSSESQPIAISVDLPLDEAARRVLEHAAEEALRLAHTNIGTEHLLLGLLREEHGIVAEALHAPTTPGIAEVRKAIGEALAAESRVRPAPAIHLVDEATGQHLPANLSFHPLPRIGEAVQLTPTDGPPLTYRVTDVRWDLESGLGNTPPTLSAIHLRLRSE